MSAVGSRLAHLPGLDGLRGALMVLILCFHGGYTDLAGSFFSISMFFTLSGYLIVTLLLGVTGSDGHADLGRFWRRRARRLAPAGVAGVVVAVVFTVFVGTATQQTQLAGDAIASLANVANWWFLASDQSYTSLFAAPSPLTPYWSLSIEVQVYLGLPLLVVAASRLGSPDPRALRRRVFAAIAVVGAGALAAVVVVNPGVDAGYFATWARLPEFATGALAGVVLSGGTLRQRLVDSRASWVTALTTATSVTAIGVLALLVATVSFTAPWVYRGGFAAFSLLSIALVISLHQRSNPVARLLSFRPLVHFGTVSYGTYLYHWPIFLWLTPARTGLEGIPLFGLRVAVTVALAEISWRLLEVPVRTAGSLSLRGLNLGARFAPLVVVPLVATAVVVSAAAPVPPPDLNVAGQQLDRLTRQAPLGAPGSPAASATAGEVSGEVSGEGSGTTPTGDDASDPGAGAVAPGASGPDADDGDLRVAIYGDSTAVMAGFGLVQWAADTPGVQAVPGSAVTGCGAALGGTRLLADGSTQEIPGRCTQWPSVWAATTRLGRPHLAVVQLSLWDTMPRQVPDPSGPPGAVRMAEPGDEAWHEVVLGEYLDAIDVLAAGGATVVWLTPPPPNVNLAPSNIFEGYSPLAIARVAALRDVADDLARLRPEGVEVVDLAAWHDSVGNDDLRLRPDGIHLEGDTARDVFDRFLGPELLRVGSTPGVRNRATTLPATAASATGAISASTRDAPSPRPYQPGLPLRVVVWGGPGVDATAREVRRAAAADGVDVSVVVADAGACGVAPVRERQGVDRPQRCGSQRELWEAVVAHAPHAVVVAPGALDASVARVFPGDDDWYAPGDQPFDGWLLATYTGVADAIADAGAAVVFSTDGLGTDPAHLAVAELLELVGAARAPRGVVQVVGAGPLGAGTDIAVALARLTTPVPSN